MRSKIDKAILLLFLFCSFLAEAAPCINLCPKKALITGVTGQDGIYLAELLLSKGYEVHGCARLQTPPANSIAHLIDSKRFFLHCVNISDGLAASLLIEQIQPDEVYHLAAQSSVKNSFACPLETCEINGMTVVRLLECLRELRLKKSIKFFQASSCEIFGQAQEIPQTEKTPFHPSSPYGAAKLLAHCMTTYYREVHGLFCCSGILFNHESPLRGKEFVSRKITLAACRYRLGLQKTLYLGNIDAKRDWGFAKDYVRAMWLMLQQPAADDYVIATGESHTVREFVELAFKALGVSIQWEGEGVEEIGIDKSSGEAVVKIDPVFYRPAEANFFLGDPKKATEVLEWKPEITFESMVQLMVQTDLENLKKGIAD